MAFLNVLKQRLAPLVLYKLAEGSGTTMVDSSGNGRDGAYTGTVTFGSTSLVEGDHSILLAGAGSGSVADAAWMEVNNATLIAVYSTTDTAARYIGGRWGATSADQQIFLDFSTTQIRAYSRTAAGNVTLSASATGLRDGNRHLVIATHNGTNLILWVDGVQVASGAVVGNLVTTGNIPLTVGRRSDNVTANRFSGNLAYFAMVGAAVTQADVDVLYASFLATITGRDDATSDATAAAIVGQVATGRGDATSDATSAAIVGRITITSGARAEAVTDATAVADIGFPPDVLTGQGDGYTDSTAGAVVGQVATGQGDAASEATAAADIGDPVYTLTAAGDACSDATATAWTEPLPLELDQDLVDVGEPDIAFLDEQWHTWPAVTPAPTTAGQVFDIALANGPVTLTGAQPRYSVHTAWRERLPIRILAGAGEDTTDITRVNDIPTYVVEYQRIQPGSYGPAVIRIDGINANHTNLKTIPWLRKKTRVIIQPYDPDTLQVLPAYWRGRILTWDTDGAVLTVQLAGMLTGPGALKHRPFKLERRLADGREWIKGMVRYLRQNLLDGPDTGIDLITPPSGKVWDGIQHVITNLRDWTLRYRDDEEAHGWELVEKDRTTIHFTVYFDDARYVQSLRSDAAEELDEFYGEGIAPNGMKIIEARLPALVSTDPTPYPMADGEPFGQGTTDADTVTGAGVSDLIYRLVYNSYLDRDDQGGGYDADVTEAVRRLRNDMHLMDDEDVDGEAWGQMTPQLWDRLMDNNVGNPLSYKEARVLPTAVASDVDEFLRTASGNVLEPNPDFDPVEASMRISGHANFEHATVKQVRRWSHDELVDEESWIGSVKTQMAFVRGDHTPGTPIGPEDVFPFLEVTEGMNFRAPQWQGGTVLSVSGTKVLNHFEDFTMLADTRDRDTITAREVHLRNKENKNPSRMFWRDRTATLSPDRTSGWYAHCGFLDHDVELVADTWNYLPELAAAEVGIIGELDLRLVENECEFVTVIAARELGEGYLESRCPDPFAEVAKAQWKAHRREMKRRRRVVNVWGTPAAPGGYGEGQKADDDPINGRLFDDTGWTFWNGGAGYSPMLWTAIYPKADCRLERGRLMKIQLPES